MLKKIKRIVLKWPLPFIGILIFVVYFRIVGGFFEQDEWHSFGHYIRLSQLQRPAFLGLALENSLLGHFTPLSLFTKMNLYKAFGLQASSYFWTSIVGHFLVSIALYHLTLILTRKRAVSFLATAFFALNSSQYQAVTWIGTFEGVQGATLFSLLAAIFLFKYTKKSSLRYLATMSASILAGMLFKEIAFAFFAALFVVSEIWAKKSVKVNLRIAFVLMAVVYIALKQVYLLFPHSPSVDQSVTSLAEAPLIVLYNAVTLGIKMPVLALIPREILVSISSVNANLSKYIFDFVTITLGIIIFVIVKHIYTRLNRDKAFTLGVLVVLFTVLPLLALFRYQIFVDSRALYSSTIGVSLVIAGVMSKFNSKKLIYALVAVVVVHALVLQFTISKLLNDANTRRYITEKITNSYPDLPDRAVLFVESDTPYYGLSQDDKTLPFQSGFGQMLLVLYNEQENYPREFFEKNFLWDIKSQGYMEARSRGFGYYRDVGELEKIVRSSTLAGSNIFAFSWSGETQELVNITDEIRKKIYNNI